MAHVVLAMIFSFHLSSFCEINLEGFLSSSNKARSHRTSSAIKALYQNVNAETIVGAMRIDPYVWFNLMWWSAYATEEDNALTLKLDEIAKKYHDAVQQMFTHYAESERIDPNVLEAFKKFDAQPNEKASTSAYTPFEILEARYSARSKKVIPGVQCKKCDTWGTFFSWFFHVGYDQECTTMKRGIILLNKENN